MDLRFRLLGLVILACGIAVCRGAFLLWPSTFEPTLPEISIGALRVVAAALIAILGVLNVVGGTIVLLRPARH